MCDLASSWINWRSFFKIESCQVIKLPNKFILPYDVGHSLYTGRVTHQTSLINNTVYCFIYLVFIHPCVESGRSLLTWPASSPPCPREQSCLKKQGGQCLRNDTRRPLVSTCMNTCVHTHEWTNTRTHTCDYIQSSGSGRVWGPRVNSQYIRRQQQYVSFFSLVKGQEQNRSDLY